MGSVLVYIGRCGFGDAENADGIQLLKWNLQYDTECRRIWQSLNELMKSRAVHRIDLRYGLVSVNTEAHLKSV